MAKDSLARPYYRIVPRLDFLSPFCNPTVGIYGAYQACRACGMMFLSLPSPIYALFTKGMMHLPTFSVFFYFFFPFHTSTNSSLIFCLAIEILRTSHLYPAARYLRILGFHRHMILLQAIDNSFLSMHV